MPLPFHSPNCRARSRLVWIARARPALAGRRMLAGCSLHNRRGSNPRCARQRWLTCRRARPGLRFNEHLVEEDERLLTPLLIATYARQAFSAKARLRCALRGCISAVALLDCRSFVVVRCERPTENRTCLSPPSPPRP